MKGFGTLITELDYEQLPPALRRKYFSSLERLRLAQDGSSFPQSRFPREPQQRPLTSSNSSTFSTRRSTLRPSITSDECALTSTPSVRTKLRKQSRLGSVSSQQVAEFASLPPALQRKYFSREEQILLASRINRVILDAADEVLYKQYGQKSRSSSIHPDLPYDQEDFYDSELEDMDLSQAELKSLQWLEEEEDLDLTLYDYHAAVSETAQTNRLSVRRASYRRALMPTGVSFTRRSSSTTSLAAQGQWPLTPTSLAGTNKLHRAAQPSFAGNHRKNRASISSLDPDAAHYQDPAARMKLRVYLASAQKFDEALEFGFPSIQESDVVRSARPTTTIRSADSHSHILVQDDTPSLSDGDDQDVDTFDSPRTPEMAAFSSIYPKSKESSLDQMSIKPRIVRDFTDPYVHALASNREMTLRMTLTRPDLRSPDEICSTRNINARPLEQAPMHFSDDVASFWDSMPDSENKVKKLFRRLKLRS